MRATQLIRQVLDLLDNIDTQHDASLPLDIVSSAPDPSAEPGEPVASRFKQILAMLNNPADGNYSNTPNEVIAPISAVTTDAGGGVNGPKNPADIRVKDPRGF